VWPLSAPAQRALSQSHGMTVRATAYGAFGMQEIPIDGGSVVSDGKSQVRRTATLSTSANLWPVDPRSVLAPFGTEIQVDYGIVLTGGAVEWVPLIRGLLTEASRERPIDTNGQLPLTLVDRSARVAEDRFTAPVQTVSGATTVTEIRRLIQETLGVAVPVTDYTGSVQVAAVLDIERERWADGVEALANSISAEVFFDPQGNGIIRPQPLITDTRVWTVNSGEQGVLISKGEKLAREGVYNGVVASGQRSDGTAPATATVWDTDTESPTYYLGTFGRKPRFYTSQMLTTVPQCTATATALLARVKGMSAQISLTTLANPALEAGDVILAHDVEEGTAQAHIIDKVAVPLSPSDTQPIETRSVELPAES